MDRPTHTWIAARAVALIEDQGSTPGLVDLLRPYACTATVGAWLPDMPSDRLGSGLIGNHVFKIKPYEETGDKHYIVSRDKLLKRPGDLRAVTGFLKDPNWQLPSGWWSAAYKGDADPGRHIPNRAMAISVMLKDLLLLGDRSVDELLPGGVDFTKYLAPDVRTQSAAVATYFFMLSHFTADGTMPAHADARGIWSTSRNPSKLHRAWEKRLARIVGKEFRDQELICPGVIPTALRSGPDVVTQSRKVDVPFEREPIPELGKTDSGRPNDVWLEMVNVCRASFAVASIVAPVQRWPYDDTNIDAGLDDVFNGPNAVPAAEVDRVVLHDAVLDTAVVWQQVWKDLSK